MEKSSFIGFKRLNKEVTVWFIAHTSPGKKLVDYYVLVYVWFIAKILAANEYPSISLTDSCQIFGQVWVENFLAKILASQFLPTFGRARLGHEPNKHAEFLEVSKQNYSTPWNY
jgi:hypothetical protein